MSSQSDAFLKLINQQFEDADRKVADDPARYRTRPEPGEPVRQMLEMFDLTISRIFKGEYAVVTNQLKIVHEFFDVSQSLVRESHGVEIRNVTSDSNVPQ
jgi:hypothetical protein